MDHETLALRLAQGDEAERSALLARHPELADVQLARALKRVYDETESSSPTTAAGAAGALMALAAARAQPEIQALAAWAGGMAALDAGRMEEAIALLDEAEARFLASGQPHTAAATQVSKLIALAILGRYDEAIACGARARAALEAHGDMLAAGKVEQNLGNIYHRRDQYAEAEELYRSARERFLALGDAKLLALAENGLANILSLRHQFRAARELYEQALERARAAGLSVTQAMIECNLGDLALFQGRYDEALSHLERSRRRYATLGMPHESAIAELEQAEVYLELNLAPEAAAMYERIAPIFAAHGMRAEQARATAQHAHACVLLGRAEQARALLDEARALYRVEGNPVGEASVTLSAALLSYQSGDLAAAAAAARQAESPLTAAGARGRALMARWLRGEVARVRGHRRAARTLLESTLRDAERQLIPPVAQRCLTSLGMLAADEGDDPGAASALERAVTLIEELRAPLPAGEFRAAFVADKLAPFSELARLALRAGRPAAAFDYVERMRARALLELAGGQPPPARPSDPLEARLVERIAELREELNWFYSQISRPPDGEAARTPAAMEELYEAARERETLLLEAERRVQGQLGGAGAPAGPLDDQELRSRLGDHTALVEYFALDGELIAFVVTGDGVEAVRGLGCVQDAAAAIEQLQFQIGSLRFGAARLRSHLGQLAQRARHYLAALHAQLLRPIEPLIGDRRLAVVPHGALHYAPFHALYDGERFVVERREVVYAPSARLLCHCLARPRRALREALLLGVPSKYTPRVHDEALALAPLFPEATLLLGEQATLAALHERAPTADLLHLACHGQFRPDSPRFSSLHLADGWLTVRDASRLELSCGLVTLSACETGVGALAPGDELIGLASGFFAAGAPSLLVSLWSVDDETTASLMAGFYEALRGGAGPAAALRAAQRDLLAREPHPFFWAPFVLFGRW